MPDRGRVREMRTDVYVYRDVMNNDMHDIMLFRGQISLVVLLWSATTFHVMRGQILIF